MAKLRGIYKCEICGNIVEVLHEGADSLVCCGQPMNLISEKSEDPEIGEKHVPVIEGNKVKVSLVEHPMTDEHYIEWIEATSEADAWNQWCVPDINPPYECTGQAFVDANADCTSKGYDGVNSIANGIPSPG